ncbi:MAG: hypothetical protein JEZ00_03650 [Anaerolineaceae bacterium]|nr:hypothetical protein [Anaerolineaceae bacterium]
MTLLIILFGAVACNGYPLNRFFEPLQQTATPIPIPLIESSNTPEVISAEQETATSYFQITPDEKDCRIALAGNPLDVSIPDGTILDPGEEFVKIWRMKNAGACIWTRQYTINWFSGEQLGINNKVSFSEDIHPGETIEIAVYMKAPMTAGSYQSNWKLCDDAGQCFGLGPAGAYPFWANIKVRQIGTVSPSPKPSSTPTSVIHIDGKTILKSGDKFDLDGEHFGNDFAADIELQNTDEGLMLTAINQTHVAWFGQIQPTESQCMNLLYVSDTISLQDMDTLAVLCYKSTLGLPGFIKFNMIDLQKGKVEIEYTTWYAP